ncbi:isoleucine--tRNA ligase [Candidatus Dojkabacteria bacterium]|nr:isoleucine--tRNA ligase [Candidatus Dojkabacteria bacterium]
MFKKINPRQNFAEQEEQILKFWKDRKIFEKSVESRPEENKYVFYDGPPFITGTPHYGSLLPSIAKDVVPRYQTMQGKRVERVWGWDAHGLPIENKVEKKLELKNRRDIESYGIQKFIDECYKYTEETSAEWEWYVDHIGRWVDFKNAYKTIDQNYMESVIWVFKQLYDKGFIYEGVRTSLYCTRCGTPVSNFEIAMDNSYTDMEDPAVTVKFKVKNGSKFKDTYILAWTTTPWTLPSNRALVVDEEEDYVIAGFKGEKVIIAKKRLEYVFSEKFTGEEKYKILDTFKGKELTGLEYEPPYKFFPPNSKDWKVYSFKGMVHMEEGTGIVHSAPGFGEIDTEMGRETGLTIMTGVDDAGKFVSEVKPWAGIYVKEADKNIVEELQSRKLLFNNEKIVHRYPYCWRCQTPLIHRAQDSWFINIQDMKQSLLKNNEKINWVPDHLKTGRFKVGIDSAPDWCISRTRYWATPMPVWRHENGSECSHTMVFGSKKEIEEASGQTIVDFHRPKIDEIVVKCEKCGKDMHRIKEVLDVWLDSASMPYAQIHYPFENKESFEKNFPADFIVEYIAQTRAWFYVMHVVSTAMFDTNSFKNVVTTGVIFGNDGRKMSKNYGNYPDPKETIKKYGGDALRLYLMGSKVMVGDDVNINEEEIADQIKNFILMLWNSYSFLITYAEIHKWSPNNSLVTNAFSSQKDKESLCNYKVPLKLDNQLDTWIVARLQETIKAVTNAMQEYQIPSAAREFSPLLEDISKWYIRRSRDRFAEGEIKAFETLYFVLIEFIKLLAPFAPFITEAMYENLVKSQLIEVEESIHLTSYPQDDIEFLEKNAPLLTEMKIVRDIVNLGQAARINSGTKVRQPLAAAYVKSNTKDQDLKDWMKELIKEELNVKEVKEIQESPAEKGWITEAAMNGHLAVSLNTTLTEELRREGTLREIIRTVQAARKKQGLKIGDKIKLQIYTESIMIKEFFAALNEELKQGISADEIIESDTPQKNEINLNGEKLTFEIK